MSQHIRNIDGPTPLQWLLAEIERMPGCPDTKRGVLALIRTAAGQRLYISRRDTISPHRVEQARAMLASGTSAKDVRRRIAVRFACSKNTAARIVSCALSQMQHAPRAQAKAAGAQYMLALDERAE